MNLLQKIARSFGYELVKKTGNPGLDFHLADILFNNQVSLIIDVGANNGQFGKKCRSFGYRGQIFSFEPNPSVFYNLQQIVDNDPNWQAFNLALGRENGEIELNISESSDLTSILAPSAYGSERFETMRTVKTERVPMTTLDNFLDQQFEGAIPRSVMLKMDTQGFDLEVFAGAEKHLGIISCLLSEVSFIPIYEGMPSFDQSLAAYRSSGFQVSGLYPVTRDKNSRVIIEMDCVMVRQ